MVRRMAERPPTAAPDAATGSADPAAAPWWTPYARPGKAAKPGAAGPADALDFAAIVARFESPLLRYVAPLAPSADEAEDIVQDAFLRLHRQVASRGRASITNLSSWLYRVAHNVARDAGRRASRRDAAHASLTEQAAADPAATLDEADQLGELERQEAADRAMAELKQLPDHQQEVLLLKITQNMTLRQIAEATGLTVGNVGYRINQGLLELTKRLKRAGVI
jgi:RNA polymerase sigma factor (sigma-70 family)